MLPPIPPTYMNLSGKPFQAVCQFSIKSPLKSSFVIHDELVIPPGQAKLKRLVALGAHNGSKRHYCLKLRKPWKFGRLRIGIGIRTRKPKVANYVLKKSRTWRISQKAEQTHDESLRYVMTSEGNLEFRNESTHSFKA